MSEKERSILDMDDGEFYNFIEVKREEAEWQEDLWRDGYYG